MTDTTTDTIAKLFLEYSDRRLGQLTTDLKACLGRLTDVQVWERHGAHENAVGNLVLHMCGNMRQWIMHGVGGAKDVRERDKEFSADGGRSAAELAELFEATAAEARKVIASVTAVRLTERITPQAREVSVLEAINQVVGHVQCHVGQVVVLTKQMTGRDLDLSIPRPR
ncbi:DinB family protein [Edaphobacter bradus]|uniref:DinB family protein n=1 Tax=Edaphobacter bradus TaxID=2259016 RepID=UPI0021E00599|nr:DUF1572 domain-containing protein [Edaphobacter bradus]